MSRVVGVACTATRVVTGAFSWAVPFWGLSPVNQPWLPFSERLSSPLDRVPSQLRSEYLLSCADPRSTRFHWARMPQTTHGSLSHFPILAIPGRRRERGSTGGQKDRPKDEPCELSPSRAEFGTASSQSDGSGTGEMAPANGGGRQNMERPVRCAEITDGTASRLPRLGPQIPG